MKFTSKCKDIKYNNLERANQNRKTNTECFISTWILVVKLNITKVPSIKPQRLKIYEWTRAEMYLPRKVKYTLQLCRDRGLFGEKRELTEGIQKRTTKTKDHLGSYMET